MNDQDRKNLAGYWMGGAIANFPRIFWSNGNSKKFDDRINRSIFSSNWDRGIDPSLREAYISGGPEKLAREGFRVFGRHIPVTESPFVPSDLSQSGKYKPDPYGGYLESDVITVTPSAQSQRFLDNKIDKQIGGSGADMLWGNPEKPRYEYARGNLRSVGAIPSDNPAAYITRVTLDPEDKGNYLFTREIQELTEAGKPIPQWGQHPVNDDLMYNKNLISRGGLTTASDVFTKLKELGVEPPERRLADSAHYFKSLTERLAEELGTSEFEALRDIASPEPEMGNPSRNLGSLPRPKGIRFFEAAPDAQLAAGISTRESSEVDTPISRRRRTTIFQPFSGLNDKYLVDSHHLVAQDRYFRVNPEISNPHPRLFPTIGGKLKGHLGGITSTTLMSPEIFNQLEAGNYGEAAIQTGSSYAVGDAMQRATNLGLDQLARRGISAPAQFVAGASAPLAAIPIAAMAERSTPSIDSKSLDDSDPRKIHISKNTPSLLGQYGPDNAFAELPAEEQRRIRALPDWDQRNKVLPIGNQILNNTKRLAGQIFDFFTP